jgi:hypothetical protein
VGAKEEYQTVTETDVVSPPPPPFGRSSFSGCLTRVLALQNMPTTTHDAREPQTRVDQTAPAAKPASSLPGLAVDQLTSPRTGCLCVSFPPYLGQFRRTVCTRFSARAFASAPRRANLSHKSYKSLDASGRAALCRHVCPILPTPTWSPRWRTSRRTSSRWSPPARCRCDCGALYCHITKDISLVIWKIF